MTKKAFRGFIAVLIVVVLLAVGWLIGWGITGNLNPVDWGKNQTQPEKENKAEMTAFISSRLTAKTMSATVDGENEIQSYAEKSSTSNVENYNGSYMDFVSDLGGGIYKVHNKTFSMSQNAYGADSFVATDGTTEKNHSSLSMFKTSCVLYYSYSNPDDSYGKAVLRFSTCTPSDFGLPSNSVLQEIQLMFRSGSTYRTITPKIYKCNNGYITDVYDGNAVSVVKFIYRVSASLPADPVKDGHTFVGWYYDSDFNTPYAGEPIYSDTQLYAKFEINKYTVTFVSDGGTEIDSQSVNWNTSATLTTPTREGYTFKGWYLSNGTQYTNQAIKENTTLTAHWEVIMCTVTFYVDGEVYETKQVEYGTPFAEVLEYANKQNLIVSLISSLDGEVIDDYSAVSISENYSVVAEQMQGQEKFLNVLKNYWQYIVAGVGTLAVICGVIGVAVSKRKN